MNEGVALAGKVCVVVVGKVMVEEVFVLETLFVAKQLVNYGRNSNINCKIFIFDERSETKCAHLQMYPKNDNRESLEKLLIY